VGHGAGDIDSGGRKIALAHAANSHDPKKVFIIKYLKYTPRGWLAVKSTWFAVMLLLSACGHAQQQHRCAADAVKQAKALLIFHNGADVNVGVDETVKVLPPLRNPVNRRQFFDVLEVRGYVYRANYQMRLIYAQIPGACALMGQEILERSTP
jgi:hypothetical protein